MGRDERKRGAKARDGVIPAPDDRMAVAMRGIVTRIADSAAAPPQAVVAEVAIEDEAHEAEGPAPP